MSSPRFPLTISGRVSSGIGEFQSSAGFLADVMEYLDRSGGKHSIHAAALIRFPLAARVRSLWNFDP
jgi:hypothetical protein